MCGAASIVSAPATRSRRRLDGVEVDATPSEREPRITRSLSTQDPQQFEDERAYIEKTFTPLVERCKELGRAIRIGTNHGDRSLRESPVLLRGQRAGHGRERPGIREYL